MKKTGENICEASTPAKTFRRVVLGASRTLFSTFFITISRRYASSPRRHPDTPSPRYVSPDRPDTFLLAARFRSGRLFLPTLDATLSPSGLGQLNRFQETITHDEFVGLLESVYAPNGAAAQWIRVEATEAVIQEDASDHFVLRFAPSTETSKPVPRYWTAARV